MSPQNLTVNIIICYKDISSQKHFVLASLKH